MSTVEDNAAPATPAGYTPAHGGMCPLGPHLVCADHNAMPQRMWRTDVQRWQCEGCGTPMVRTFDRGRGWSAWQPVVEHAPRHHPHPVTTNDAPRHGVPPSRTHTRR